MFTFIPTYFYYENMYAFKEILPICIALTIRWSRIPIWWIFTAFRDIPQNGIAISHAIAQRIWKQHQHVYHILSIIYISCFHFHVPKTLTTFLPQPGHVLNNRMTRKLSTPPWSRAFEANPVSFLEGKKAPRFRFRVRLWTHIYIYTYVYVNKYMYIYINTYANMYVSNIQLNYIYIYIKCR